jgi:serine/threonine protein kinase
VSEPKKEKNPYAEELIKDRYLAEEFILAKGGIGFVFKAKDKVEKKEVVIKVLQRQLVEDPWIVSKFYSEAKAIMRIHQLQDSLGKEKYSQEEKQSLGLIVKGIETDELSDGSPYLVMEFIDGFSLRNVIKENSHGVSLERAANILKELGIALSLVHKNGIYHRDLKPENIMLTMSKAGQEHIKIIDFGIATVKESPSEKTQTTALPAGTMAYMAQEQIMAKPSASSDIYAMGVIAYELITGRRPFYLEQANEGSAAVRFYNAQAEGLKVRPKVLRDFLPNEADELIVKALSFNPEERFSSAEEFGKLLSDSLTKSDEEATLIQNSQTEKVTLREKTAITKPINTKTSIKKTFVDKNISANKVIFLGFFLGAVALFGFLFIKIQTPSNKLAYSIELQRFSDGNYKVPIQLAGRTSFSSKDRIKFNITFQKDGYVYLLNESPTKLETGLPKYTVLYPRPEENNYFPLGQMIKVPSASESWLQFAGSTGVEKIWIIWSKERIPELENVRPLLKLRGGAVLDEVQISSLAKFLDKYNKNVNSQENEKANLVYVTSRENVIVVAASLIHQ